MENYKVTLSEQERAELQGIAGKGTHAASKVINARGETPIIVRQVKYLNNIVEQDHRAIKRVTRPMHNFKSFRSAKNALVGIELMDMIRKGQLLLESRIGLSFADQFYALVGKIRPA